MSSSSYLYRSGTGSYGYSDSYYDSQYRSYTRSSGKHFKSSGSRDPVVKPSKAPSLNITPTNVPGSEECIPVSKLSKCLPKLVQCYNALCNPQKSWFPPPGVPPFCFDQKAEAGPPNMNVNIFRAPPHSVLADILKESVGLNQGTVATEKCKCVIINPLNPIESIALNHNKNTDEVSVSRLPKHRSQAAASTVFSPQFQNCHFYSIGSDNQKEQIQKATALKNRAESLSLRKRRRRNSFTATDLSLLRSGSFVSDVSQGDL